MKAPYDPEAPRIPVSADDPRIERVFEISRLPRNTASNGIEEPQEEDEENGLLEGFVEHAEEMSERQKGKQNESSSYAKGKAKWRMGKEKKEENDMGRGANRKAKRTDGGIKEPRYERAPTPDDSSEDDRHENDAGFPEVNEKGKYLKMQVSEKPRFDFAELQCEHLGGTLWEILTGIEARTKFTNTELKHEGMFSNLMRCNRLGIDHWS